MHPPRAVEHLLEAFGPPTRFREAVLGDLAEDFAYRAAAGDARSARSWYCREAVRTAPHLLNDGLRSLSAADRASMLGRVLLCAATAFIASVAWFVAVLLAARSVDACCPVAVHLPRGLWMLALFGGIGLPFAFAGALLWRITRRAAALGVLLLIVVAPAVIELLLYVDNSTSNLETRMMMWAMAAIAVLFGAVRAARRDRATSGWAGGAALPVLLLGALLTPSEGRAQSAPRSATVPLIVEKNRPYVDVTFTRADGSRRTARLLLDTGGGGFLIGEPLARDLGLKWGPTAREEGAEFARVESTPSVSVGDFALALNPSRVLVLIGQKGPLSRIGVEAEGMIPGHVLAQYHVIFDYPASTFTIAQPGALTPRGESLPMPVGRTGFPRTEIVVEGQTLGLLLDTGASFTMVSDALLKGLGSAHPDWRRYSGAHGDAATLGGQTLETMYVPRGTWGSFPLGEFGITSQREGTFERYMSGMMTSPIIGALAGNVLKQFRVELDYANAKVYLSKPSSSPAPLEWVAARPETLGVDTVALRQHRELCARSGADACLVARNGTLVDEWYGPGYAAPMAAMSSTKSIAGLLVGLLVADGRMKLDDPVSRFVPEWKAGAAGKVTVRHLLTMTSGLPNDQKPGSPNVGRVTDKDSLVFTLPLAGAPGASWAYSNNGTHLVSAIIRRAAGESIHDYARRRLFEPLGLRATRLHEYPTGQVWLHAEMQTTPRELARIGQMMLDGGRWGGRQVVPESWVRESTQPSQSLAPYGYLWWLDVTDGFAARGYLDNNLYVLPKQGLVIVRMQVKTVPGAAMYDREAQRIFARLVSRP